MGFGPILRGFLRQISGCQWDSFGKNPIVRNATRIAFGGFNLSRFQERLGIIEKVNKLNVDFYNK
jgi:hypothetical protein